MPNVTMTIDGPAEITRSIVLAADNCEGHDPALRARLLGARGCMQDYEDNRGDDTMTIDDGGPAFPPTISKSRWGRGMTYRQWLAGLAMQGLARESTHNQSARDIAVDAVELADALIAELQKETP